MNVHISTIIHIYHSYIFTTSIQVDVENIRMCSNGQQINN